LPSLINFLITEDLQVDYLIRLAKVSGNFPENQSITTGGFPPIRAMNTDAVKYKPETKITTSQKKEYFEPSLFCRNTATAEKSENPDKNNIK
jgi:hypothetical protein